MKNEPSSQRNTKATVSQSIPFQNSQISNYASKKGDIKANISNKMFMTTIDKDVMERQKINDMLN